MLKDHEEITVVKLRIGNCNKIDDAISVFHRHLLRSNPSPADLVKLYDILSILFGIRRSVKHGEAEVHLCPKDVSKEDLYRAIALSARQLQDWMFENAGDTDDWPLHLHVDNDEDAQHLCDLLTRLRTLLTALDRQKE